MNILKIIIRVWLENILPAPKLVISEIDVHVQVSMHPAQHGVEVGRCQGLASTTSTQMIKTAVDVPAHEC